MARTQRGLYVCKMDIELDFRLLISCLYIYIYFCLYIRDFSLYKRRFHQFNAIEYVGSILRGLQIQKEPTLGIYDQTFNIKWCENLKARYVLSSQSLFVKDVQKKLEWNWTVEKVLQQISLHSTTTKYCQEIRELKRTKIRRDPLHRRDYVSVLWCTTFNNHRWEKLSFHSQVPPLGPVLQRYPHIQSFIGKNNQGQTLQDAANPGETVSNTHNLKTHVTLFVSVCPVTEHPPTASDGSVWYSYSNSWSFSGKNCLIVFIISSKTT